ncbi:hypothetical protein EOA78_31500 [Mesorhizobium sp. M5C.F.Cr.IN.023.01.1.1]|uniref:hypothetical protein n=1 Tax=Mesorhizobium sp. M5C.F.Cr.IN.023.01.1.1 TaxID=2496768 RepID=UPI000FCBBDAD|nr:hypothetical protein [Mesorhizobium sp. M5C.F.Cr.IN.023.01.1.1]RUV67116.1 hypothetical protein EOA78_31500 [Mesorhizobium sp. M5C.F.Cr.IN.023.01.1.1]
MHAEKLSDQDDDLERDVDAVIVSCDGDARAAVRALIVQVAYLEREIQYFRGRGLLRLQPAVASQEMGDRN